MMTAAAQAMYMFSDFYAIVGNFYISYHNG